MAFCAGEGGCDGWIEMGEGGGSILGRWEGFAGLFLFTLHNLLLPWQLFCDNMKHVKVAFCLFPMPGCSEQEEK